MRGVYILFVITISRQTASLGNKISRLLSRKLGVELITRDYVLENWLPEVASAHELNILKESSRVYNRTFKNNTTVADYIEKKLIHTANEKSITIRGLGSQVIFSDYPQALHVRIVAGTKTRINRLQKKYGLKKTQAERSLELSDRKRKRYIWRIYEKDWTDSILYHICLNTDGINSENIVQLLINYLELRKNSPNFLNNDDSDDLIEELEDIDFAHESEFEFAKILDMHNIQWQYEPTQFPLEWDAEGRISMGFRPDFYLSEFNTYIELTTMKQKYVTEKNKKVRLLKKLYPEVNINIVYKKDYNSLIERFGGIKGD